MKYYFYLQYQRLKRVTTDSGIHFITAIAIACFGFILFSTMVFGKIRYAEYIYSVIGIFLVNLLGKKERNFFLRYTFSKNNYHKIRIAENLVCIFPFVSFLIFKQFYIPALILLLLATVFSFFNSFKKTNFYFPTPFFKRPFEFVVGFRNLFWLFLISYLLTVFAIVYNNFNLGVFALLINAFSCVSFYTKTEHPFFVWVYKYNSASFLRQKIITGIIYYSLLILPIIIALLIFKIEYWHIILLCFVIGYLYVALSLLGKYAYYPTENNLIQGFAIGFSMAFPPLLLILIPVFYNKSKQKLKFYLR